MNWHAQTKFLLTTSLNSIQLSILTIAIAHHSCYQQIILRLENVKTRLIEFYGSGIVLVMQLLRNTRWKRVAT